MADRIEHHPDDGLLASYAAGALPEAFSVVLAAHVSLCPSCRAGVGALEAPGGVLLEAMTGAEMSQVSLERTIARVRRSSRDAASEAERRGRLPAPIGDYLGGDADAIAWRHIGGGVRQMKLDTAGEGSVRLISIPAGQAVPSHGHRGLELTMVLSGAYRDEIDRFGPGDVEVARDDLEHRPVAEPGETCICLAATSAPLRFHGLVPRLLGPVLGI